MKRIITAIIAAYIALSAIFSIAISMTGNYDIAEHHAPLLLVEVVTSTVDEVEPDGYGCATDSNGNFIGFGAQDAVKVGDRHLHFFIYNPFSNASDDIIARYDFQM